MMFADGLLSKAAALHCKFIPALVAAYSCFGAAVAPRITLEQASVYCRRAVGR